MSNTAELRDTLAALYADYAACLDAGAFDAWPEFFTEDCRYRLVPRENYDRGLPLSTMDLQGKAMLRDRVYGVQSTLFHAPYYQRHLIGPLRILSHDEGMAQVEANYLVIRTKVDAPSDLFNAGRYIDRIALSDSGARFAEKLCVFDTELIPNSLIYPV